MKTVHNSYPLSDSDTSEDYWPMSVLLATLTLVVTLFFDAHLQFVSVFSGKTAEFVTLIIGILGGGIGLLVGTKYKGAQKPVFQRVLAGALLLQALLLYLLNKRYGIPLMAEGSFIVAAMLVMNALAAGARMSGILATSRTMDSRSFPLAIVAGAAIGIALQTSAPITLGAPVLLFLAGGALLATAKLGPKDKCANTLQRRQNGSGVSLAFLALIGTLTLSIITQVMIQREEFHALSTLSNQGSHVSGSRTLVNRVFWAYGAESLPRETLSEAGARSDKEMSGLLRGAYGDSLSILLTDCVPSELQGLQALNCAAVTSVNSSHVQTLLNRRFQEHLHLTNDNVTFTSQTSNAIDYLAGADRLWDVIWLKRSPSTRAANPLNPAPEETQEFFASCFTHLSDEGFLLFELNTSSNALEYFRRLSAVTQTLRRRGAANPSRHVAILRKSEVGSAGTTISLIFKEPVDSARIKSIIASAKNTKPVESPLSGIGSSPELRACFQPNISVTLSEQFNANLSPLSLERPFPEFTAPVRLSTIQQVQAGPLADRVRSEVTALIDVLSKPIQQAITRFNTLLTVTTVALALLLGAGFFLMRRAFVHTVRDSRLAQRRSFSAFALTLSGALVIILPAVDLSALQNSSAHLPTGLLAQTLIVAFGAGFWLEARKNNGKAKNSDLSVTLALVLALGALALPGMAAGTLVFLVLLTVSAVLLGTNSARFLRHEHLFELSKCSTALAALLFVLTAALIASEFSNAAFGYRSTIELGVAILVLGTTLHISSARLRL